MHNETRKATSHRNRIGTVAIHLNEAELLLQNEDLGSLEPAEAERLQHAFAVLKAEVIPIVNELARAKQLQINAEELDSTAECLGAGGAR